MSGGKKKSSFQITSVTLDYEGPGSPGGFRCPCHAGTPGPPAPTEPSAPAPTGPPPRLPSGSPTPSQGARAPRNGSPPPAGPRLRFRVVKLPQGLGEPYRRGRWTCVDVYERDLEPPSFGRLLESIRGASGGNGGRSLVPGWSWPAWAWAPPTHSQACLRSPPPGSAPPPPPWTSGPLLHRGLGQLAVPGKAKVETPPLSASPPQQRPQSPGPGRARARPELPRPCPP